MDLLLRSLQRDSTPEWVFLKSTSRFVASLPLHDPDPWPIKVTNNDSQDLKLVLRLIVLIWTIILQNLFFILLKVSWKLHTLSSNPPWGSFYLSQCSNPPIYHVCHLPHFLYLPSTLFFLPPIYLIYTACRLPHFPSLLVIMFWQENCQFSYSESVSDSSHFRQISFLLVPISL